MAQVTIRVECDGGSATEIIETSAIAIYGGGDAVKLVQEAFVRTCNAFGVVIRTEPPQPDPEPDLMPEPPAAEADVPSRFPGKVTAERPVSKEAA